MRNVVIEVHPIEIVTGGWCDRCALPSRVSVTLALVDPVTLKVIGRNEGSYCPDCDTP